MQFPDYMMSARRWMVRLDGKQPYSAHDTKPVEYEPPPGKEDPNGSYWRWRWTVKSVWASYQQACSYADRNSENIQGLCFVIHPVGSRDKRERLICFDFDSCIATDGAVDPAVLTFIETVGSYVEFSKNGRGLHVFVLTECEAFVNNLGKPIGGCKVDVLCSSQIAVTGEVFESYSELSSVPFKFVENLSFFDFELAKEETEFPEWWSADPLDDVPDKWEYLTSIMESWPTAVEGNNGSQVLFAAACRVLQHGATGREAEAILRLVPAVPPFEGHEIRRIVECAYARVAADCELDTLGPHNEFDVLPESTKEALEDFMTQEVEDEDDYGFEPIPVHELMRMDLKLEYLVDRAFVGEGALFVGGREKCFKTGVVVDLIMSLATGTKFLNEFAVNEQRTAVIFTAEIGLPSAQALIDRIARAKGLDPMTLSGFDVVDAIPNFQTNKNTGEFVSHKMIRRLERYLDKHKPDIAVFDPLYFAMGGSAVGDMYEIGLILRNIANICAPRNIWPIYCHHARKAGKEDEARPMELCDFYGSGIGAYARQWLLLAHAQPFRNGKASLYMNMGGSMAGDRGLWRLNIDEGDDDAILGRKWGIDLSREADETEALGLVTDDKLYEAIQTLDINGKGVTVSDLEFYLQATTANLERAIKDNIKTKLQMKPGRRFSMRLQPEDDF